MEEHWLQKIHLEFYRTLAGTDTVACDVDSDTYNISVGSLNDIYFATITKTVEKDGVIPFTIDFEYDTFNKRLIGTVKYKNAKGEEVARFETTTDPKVFTDLSDGNYTIEEISAPNGYKKSNDIITITIDEDHATHQVTFYNYPEVPVPDTASSSIIMTIIGILLIGTTVGFVAKNAKEQ